MSHLQIDHERCTLCEKCVECCPFEALSIKNERLQVGEECVLCGACVKECPEDALSIPEESPEQKPDQQGLASYRGILVLCEQQNQELHPVSLELIGRGRQLADQRSTALTAGVLGDDVMAVLKTLRNYPVDRVVKIESSELKSFRSDLYARVSAELIQREKPEIVLAGATSAGRAFLPRVAALLQTGLTADCTGLEIDEEKGLLLQTRPAFGGNIMATIICPKHRPQMATVRPNVLERPEPQDRLSSPEITGYEPSDQSLASALEILDEQIAEKGETNIGEADIIVSGGRGVGSPAGFKTIHDLADALGGMVAASRAAVDSGWISYPHQVGQTGKTVQPRLYVACGISGAVQHLVGMQSADTIIAINTDPGAPIFEVADYGFVGDLHTIAPRLATTIRQRKEISS
ncbi:MAG: electron transfer flavoprotein subunit alpha [Planctomycetes bacterium]|nr:electron transfer flavoprotein subunit alpha [Planctomycetota bacterium]